jgi:hypothetical protein
MQQSLSEILLKTIYFSQRYPFEKDLSLLAKQKEKRIQLIPKQGLALKFLS